MAISVAQYTINSLNILGNLPGSDLDGYDIVGKDAYSMIKMSLIVDSALIGGELKECYADESGNARVFSIGAGSPSLDVLYSIRTVEQVSNVENVLIIGKKPDPTITAGNWTSIFAIGDGTSWNCERLGHYFSQCDADNQAYIEHPEIEINDVEWCVAKGLYDPKELEKVLNWEWRVRGPAGATVNFANTTTRYTKLLNFGTLQEREWVSGNISNTCNPDDYSYGSSLFTGKHVTLANSEDYMGVTKVYIYGRKLDSIKFKFNDAGDAEYITCTIPSKAFDIYELGHMSDWIMRDQSVVFFSNVSPTFQPYFSSGMKYVDTATGLRYNSSNLFALGEGQSAYDVEEIVVEWGYKHSALVIQTTDYSARCSAGAEYRPWVLTEPPAPVILNGRTMDQSCLIPDADPTTVQDFSSCEITQAYNSLQGGDIQLNLSFLDENDCKRMSTFLKNVYSDTMTSQTVVCLPGSEVDLGDSYGEGVVNEIDYSYQDSSQYLITVTTGPKWGVGASAVGSWDTSVNQMKTETVTVEGVVQGLYGANINTSEDDDDRGHEDATWRVYCDSLGSLLCVKGIREKIEPGDRVQVSVSYNPVGS